MNQDSPSFTSLLRKVKEGDAAAEERLLQAVYTELKRMAANQLRHERPDHTLQPTALVHETYLRLFQGEEGRLESRSHFFAIAAREMRHVLVDHARKHRAGKRGGGAVHVDLDQVLVYSREKAREVLALDEALDRLAEIKPEAARLVDMVYFGGLTQEEAAAAMELSVRTIKRYWDFAKSFLLTEMAPEAT
jgi:RNA polymerase sigma factor (TIGR02999 family)